MIGEIVAPEIVPEDDGRKIRRRWKLRFAWYDAWIGVFWDRRQHVLYICPLPCVLIETWMEVEYDYT